jgi:hypothetical protein
MIQVPYQLATQLYGVLKVRIGGNAVMGVDVPDREAYYY